MRAFVLAAALTAGFAAAATPAIAVKIPGAPEPQAADAQTLTALPEDWLDKDLPEGEAEKADIRAAEAKRWDEPPGATEPAQQAARTDIDCSKPSGTTGAILGAVAGGLLGRAIDGGRSSAVGTIVGAGGGALLGREIERGRTKCP